MKIRTITLALLCLSAAVSANNSRCAHPEKRAVVDNAQKSIYENCERNGMTLWLKDNGDVKSQVNFTNGKENGLYTSFYANGQKKIVVNYVDGQKDGKQTVYYNNGKVGSEVNYAMGRREGVMTDWDYEGYRSAEVFYKRNYKVGLKKYYDHSGQVVKTETYEMDRNPVMLKLLKDKRKEILIDLSKYGLVPKDAPLADRMR
jgi:hypothetical protein